jgi:hypothetical protein
MKIIVNQEKELRTVGYDETIGCNPLKTEFYIAKDLNCKKPVHCVIEDRFHLLMYKIGENDNYLIYQPFDLVNIKYNEGVKTLKITFNEKESQKLDLFFMALDENSLAKFLEKEV